MIKVTKVNYLYDYELWLEFDNGSSGRVDLYPHLKGSIFEPLKNLEMFKQVQLNSETDTIAWPNGADFAPEFLLKEIKPVPSTRQC